MVSAPAPSVQPNRVLLNVAAPGARNDYANGLAMNARHSPVAATTYRGPAVENTHFAHIAIVDASGRLVYGFGDPHRPTLPRSAVKPVQALAVLETGARATKAPPA